LAYEEIELSLTISGTPAAAGDYECTMIVTGPFGDQAQKEFSIKVLGITPAPQILNPWPRNEPYSRTFVAAYMTGEVTWTGQSLPPGLTMDAASGVVSGTPTTEGLYVMTIFALDEEGHVCTNLYRQDIVECAGFELIGNWFLASAGTWRCAGEGELVFGLTKHDAFLET